ncbi:MAG TPA: glycosyltransferase family 2 protein [Chlamydiales bacterium]|nr:glycosyltransferase family 2 protein [Chlamydiales bacterium]
MHPISVTILAKNAEETLAASLNALRAFPEVIVLDTGSTDATKEIARNYPNVRFIEKPFQGFGKMHNLASDLATHDWILSIDSDEVLSCELIEEISDLQLNQEEVYSLNRCNYFQGKWMRGCSGWHPDPIVRFYHRKMTRFTDADVHESVITKHVKVVPLHGKCFHTPYRTIDHFLSKMQLYSSLFAKQNKGSPSSLGKAIWHGFVAFIKNYLFKRGIFCGKEGLIISIYNAQTTYYKYLKLAYPKFEQEIAPLAEESTQPNREG